MKLLISAITFAFVAALTPAVSAQNKPATKETNAKESAAKPAKFKLHTSYKSARKQATEEKKPILMLFTATGWCGYCKRFDGAVVDKKEFKTWAAQNVVFYVCDLKDKMVPDNAEAKGLLKQHNIHGFPTLMLSDAEGKILAPRVPTGAANVDEFIKDYNKVKSATENTGDN